MRKQLKALIDWFFQDIPHSTIIIFIFLLFISYCSIDMRNWKTTFYYPEEEYEMLENEVQLLTPDFDTFYHYKITSYNDKTKSIKFNLYYNDIGAEPYLSVSIKNFGEENQQISSSRNSPSALTHTLSGIAAVLAILGLYFIIYLAFLYLFYSVCCFISWLFLFIHKKYEQKLNKDLEKMTTLKDECDESKESNKVEDELNK